MDTWRAGRETVDRLRGSLIIEHTIAKHGSRVLSELLTERPYVHALGAMTGCQAVQMRLAGLEAIYASGWQVAADANLSGQTYSDQSLYPSNSMAALVRRINSAFQRADQIDSVDGKERVYDWYAPIIADAEAGFGGPLNVYEVVRSLIEAGAAGVHLEDQLASEKKCGHMGGKVLIPISQFIRNLKSARLAAQVCGVNTVLIGRTDARSARLMTSDIDEVDGRLLSGVRTSEGFYMIKDDVGMELAVNRAIAFAPYCDLIWMETSTPDIREAQDFAEAIHRMYPDKMLAYNCSPSFHWNKNLTPSAIRNFQSTLAGMGYKFQFITLAGFHSLNSSMFELAQGYQEFDMSAYVDLQEKEFFQARSGYTAVRHQHEVGTDYFDAIMQVVSEGRSSTVAMDGSTEQEQF